MDAGGALRVGPESAGADPGPVIYGRGGTQITVSDANALLGRLDSRRFLGGRMALDLAGARAVMAALADQTGLTPEATALGVIEVANVTIDRALRRVSVARGHDPRDFTLVAFGGADRSTPVTWPTGSRSVRADAAHAGRAMRAGLAGGGRVAGRQPGDRLRWMRGWRSDWKRH